MKITLNKLKELKACEKGLKYFKSKNFLNDEVELDELINILKEDKSNYLEWIYESFKLTGEYIRYYSDGNISCKYVYKEDKLEGEYISYYENGDIDYKCFYKDDKLEGECISYYSDGNIRYKCFYKEDKKVNENN